MTKTRFRVWPTLIIAAVVLGAAYMLPIETFLEQSKNGHHKSVEVTVAFSPAPRAMSNSIHTELTVGVERRTFRLTESPFMAAFTAKSDEAVTVSALQHTDGTVSCRIKVNRRQVAYNTTEGQLPLICTAV